MCGRREDFSKFDLYYIYGPAYCAPGDGRTMNPRTKEMLNTKKNDNYWQFQGDVEIVKLLTWDAH